MEGAHTRSSFQQSNRSMSEKPTLPVFSKGPDPRIFFKRPDKHLPHRRLSLYFTLSIEALATLLHLLGHLSILELILLGVATFSVVLLFENYLREKVARHDFRDVIPIADSLLPLFNDLDENPLKDYVADRINHIIDSLKNLLTGSPFKLTYSEQIAIANDLAKGTKIRIWATSTDKPSSLWQEGSSSYFKTQKSIAIVNQKDGMPSKARLVLLPYEILLDDFQSERIRFDEYIQWHAESGFALRFFSCEPSAYLQRDIPESSEVLLTDFLIRDSECVYGRVRQSDGSNVVLRYISSTGARDMIAKYEYAFEAAWDIAQDADTTKRQLIFESQRRKLISEHQSAINLRREIFATEYAGCEGGAHFFDRVCKRIAEADNSVRAVDIAGLKGSLEQWGNVREFNGFMNASINAAKAGKVVKRLYVVKQRNDIYTFPSVKNSIRKQINAGVIVGVVIQEAAIKGCFNTDDYILVDTNFGFYLGDAKFDMNQLNYSENILHPTHVETFVNMFDSIFDSEYVVILSKDDITNQSS